MNATLHDAYAADYDQQVQSYGCHVADVLFGLCYEYAQPGQAAAGRRHWQRAGGAALC